MPSVSKAQAKRMEAALKNPSLREEMGMSEQQVREWVEADRNRGTKDLPDRKEDKKRSKGRKGLQGVVAK